MAFPHEKLLLFFVVPVPAWVGEPFKKPLLCLTSSQAAVTGLVCYDMYLALLQPVGRTTQNTDTGGS